jgi:hypothetical protein
MAQNTRQTNLLVQQDWTKIYQSFSNADFSSYDFETLRSSMISYLKTYYPESFNDFLESSEYIALIDMIAFLGQSLAFRTDLNARENFLDTAQRRDSILKLARMLSYNPQRAVAASGLLKIDGIRTTENITDSTGINISNTTVIWNDPANDNWQEQFTSILNAALVTTQTLGKPGNSQKISGIQTDEYAINLDSTNLPVTVFSVNIQGTPTSFEAVSATTVGKTYIYQDDPTKLGRFNVLYRNDNNGNGSINTGFFLYFKQGTLNSTGFNIVNAIPNNYVSITTNNITDHDQWLYQLDVNGLPGNAWTAVPAVAGINVIYNQQNSKNLYQINSLNNDQVGLVFGDGGFANIPQGAFNFYYRTCNGQSYTLTPDDLPQVSISFRYYSKRNTLETLTVTASLKYTVTNASATQSMASIQRLAPQQYYTQNRMITAEDYQIFPQTTFNSIQKITTVNRTSSGVSLYLDGLDATGSYSSTNIFCSDGIITAQTDTTTTTFSYIDTTDIYRAIYNQVLPVLSSTDMVNYYYANARRMDVPAGLTWHQVSTNTQTCQGYLMLSGVTQQVGTGVLNNLQYIATGASLKFTAPQGQYFDAQNQLHSGSPAGPGDRTAFYAVVTGVVSHGDVTEPDLITLATQVPTGAKLGVATGLSAVIPVFNNSQTALGSDLISTMVAQILAQGNFGLWYDASAQTWVNIPATEISGTDQWLMKFQYVQGQYYVIHRRLRYVFSSAGETTFYFDPAVTVYDSMTSATVSDTIKILRINTDPYTQHPLSSDITWKVCGNVQESDGYVDRTQILVKSADIQMPGIPDDPDLFSLVAGDATSRQSLYFQYTHNVPSRNRIDPTPVNILDAYVLTADYANSYLSWLRDTTGRVSEPLPPTSSSLDIAYDALKDYKALSDTLIFNSARFKPLFGAKADAMLRANFQVVKNPVSQITDNEMRSLVISAMNTYFDLANWSFGDSFYFSELAAYLHTTLAPDLASILIVPANTNLVFGNYFQINAEPWEIITSAATVDNIQVVSAVTAAQLNLGVNLVGGQ